MKSNNKRICVTVRPLCYIIVAASVLLIPLRLVLAFMIAITVHELGHYLALKFMNVKIYALTVGTDGVLIDTEPMDRSKELLTTAAGPVFGLLPLLFYRQIPLVALFACLQTVYNLLPIYPHDGGRIIACICSGSKAGAVIQTLLRYATYFVLCFLSFSCTFVLGLGIVPIVAVFVFIIKNLGRKTPCNQYQTALQYTLK